MAETIRETNVAFMVDVVVSEAEKNINKFNNSAQSMGKSVEKANKKAQESSNKTTKEIKGLNSVFEKLPGPIGAAAKQINTYAAGLNASKKAADLAAVGTTGLAKAIRVLGLALKSSGVLIAVTVLAGLASGLSRTQNVVDAVSASAAALGNVFQKFGDNLVAGRNPFEGLLDVFNETLKLEGLSNELRDKRIKFIIREAELEKEIANARIAAEDSSLSTFQRIKAEQKIIEQTNLLFEERLELAQEEVRIEREKINLTNDIAKDKEALANVEANLINIQTEGQLRTIRNQRRLNGLQKELRKELEDTKKAIIDVSRSFNDLSLTELDVLKRDLKETLQQFKDLNQESDELQNALRELLPDFEFEEFGLGVERLEKVISEIIEEARLNAEKNALELDQEIVEKRIENDIRNESRRQRAILDSQIKFIDEQILLETKLAFTRQVNTDEDIARLKKLKEERRALIADRAASQLSLISFIFGDDVEDDDVKKALQDIQDAFNTVANIRKQFLDEAVGQQERLVQRLIGLAEFGADESLKIEQERLNTLLNEREKFVKKQQELAAIEIALNQAVAASEAIKNIATQKNPVLIALQVAALAAGISAATFAVKNAFTDLPAFYEGTEDTGRGGNVDNRGGFKAVLHPNERVVPDKYNKHLKGIKNYELPMMAQSYKMIPTMFDFMGSVDANLNRGFDGLEKQISKLGEQIGGLKIETRMDRKGFANYLMGSNSFKKLSR